MKKFGQFVNEQKDNETQNSDKMKDLIEYTNKRYPRITLSLGDSGKYIAKKIKNDGRHFEKLYRGVPSTWDFIENLKIGDNVKLNHKVGFVSTSQLQKVAERFASDENNGVRVIFEIRNAHGLDVNNISKWSNEQEVLLNRNQSWTVIGIDRMRGTWFKVIVE